MNQKDSALNGEDVRNPRGGQEFLGSILPRGWNCIIRQKSEGWAVEMNERGQPGVRNMRCFRLFLFCLSDFMVYLFLANVKQHDRVNLRKLMVEVSAAMVEGLSNFLGLRSKGQKGILSTFHSRSDLRSPRAFGIGALERFSRDFRSPSCAALGSVLRCSWFGPLRYLPP